MKIHTTFLQQFRRRCVRVGFSLSPVQKRASIRQPAAGGPTRAVNALSGIAAIGDLHYAQFAILGSTGRNDIGDVAPVLRHAVGGDRVTLTIRGKSRSVDEKP